ncbi:LysR family transcriptional regulator, hydrogen peroxide-inducible genes activator [Daejeonella rubra]|uniref:LysR family transcriptional regulator, hydrogen peroxide-inducible genes activator n=1 Tax=Daejeonella rubra TaxID=990371 RepID=A0A1G9R268_9SPHI|nr:hydrogen peroxide-inducible genes activator [Daejeonella rubra]SDM17231.1 LysR family transcriptional regulator, hydrogen peroxide-inducible genes activator [Daejeonella rubra]
MTLVQLEYIVALDTYRSFGIAAEKCFVTQPTMSMQVQKLEEELGVKLFDRSKQPITPTEIGAEVLEQARNILKESYKLKELISNQKSVVSGELRIGIIPTMAPYLMPKVISAFMDKYPDVQLVIWEYMTDQIIHELKNGLLDCGILSTPLEDKSLQEIPLFYESFVAYLSKSSPLMGKKNLMPSDINLDDLWLLNEGHCMRNQILNICKRKKSDDHKPFEYNTDSVETLKRMVEMNNGITLLPELSISDFTVKQLDRVRYFKSPEPSREISIVTHRNFLKRKLIMALEKEILDAIPKRMRNKNKKEILEIYS